MKLQKLYFGLFSAIILSMVGFAQDGNTPPDPGGTGGPGGTAGNTPIDMYEIGFFVIALLIMITLLYKKQIINSLNPNK